MPDGSAIALMVRCTIMAVIWLFRSHGDYALPALQTLGLFAFDSLSMAACLGQSLLSAGRRGRSAVWPPPRRQAL